MVSLAAGVLSLALGFAAPTKLDANTMDPQLAAALSAESEVVWLEDQMCFCYVIPLPPVPDAYRATFGPARRVHSDFRGRLVRAVEGAGL